MVKRINKTIKSSTLIVLIILVILISISVTLIIWNIVFNPGILVTYSKTVGDASGGSDGSSGGDGSGGYGGGGSIGVTIIPQNATNKTK